MKREEQLGIGTEAARSLVLPVIDLKDGMVVRGVAGRRAEYRPVKSCFASDARPGTVARALVRRFGFRRVYVADLDAIAGAEPDWTGLGEIASAGLQLLLDAGVADRARAELLAGRAELDGSLAGIIVGLESVRGPADLPRLADSIGSQRAIFSVDLMSGRPLSTASEWQQCSTEQIADTAVAAGFRRLIVLDLAAVGAGTGPRVLEVCRSIRQQHAGIELISGGGVASPSDLHAFRQAGCDAVLVASALHDGKVGIRI